MISLRLFHSSDPSRQIEARNLPSGDLVIGREPPSPGWRIDDPDRQLSRNHCTVSFRNGQITVRDTSANGLLVASLGGPAPKNEPVLVQFGESLRMGKFIIVIERGTAEAPADPLAQSLNLVRDNLAADSPFTPPAGLSQDFGSRPSSNPFGAEIKADPLAFDTPSRGGLDREPDPLNASFGQDAWDRRETRKAGDWDAPSHNQPQGHEHLIGSDRHWSAPPPPPKSEVGFGFDSPFERPIMRSVEVSRDDLEIPQDWEDPIPGERVVIPETVSLEPPPIPAPDPIPAAPIPQPDPISAPEPIPAAFDRIADPIVEDAPPSRPIVPEAPAPVAAAPEPPPPIAEPAPEPPPAAVAPPEPVAAAPAPRKGASSPGDRALLEAFCAGAKLDPEAFAREDPVVVMEKLGAVYQQMVLGLADLISERSTVRNEYRMVRTTVRPAGNNPFKWAPPARVAVDLLRSTDDGFLTGPAAVKDSFEDMKKHVICLLAGMRAAVGATLDGLAPEVAEGRATKGLLKNPGAAAWAEFRQLYADFRHQADDNPDSQINREFRAAYERQLETLDGLRPPG